MTFEDHKKTDQDWPYRGSLFNVRVDTIHRMNNTSITREVVEHGDVVAIVPIDSEGNIFMVRQHRTPASRALLEIPAGGIESGEVPSVAAQRELQEEVGMAADELEQISGFYVSPGYCTEFVHLFLARSLSEKKLEADDDEDIEVVKMPLSEALKLACSGEIKDSKSITGILLMAMENN